MLRIARYTQPFISGTMTSELGQKTDVPQMSAHGWRKNPGHRRVRCWGLKRDLSRLCVAQEGVIGLQLEVVEPATAARC